MIPQIKIKSLRDGFKLPERKTSQAACWDIYLPESIDIVSGEVNEIPLGFSLKIPEGWGMDLLLRSGINKPNLVTADYMILVNGVGVIDSDYRGEVKARIYYISDFNITTLSKHDRYFQMRLVPVYDFEFKVTDELNKTEREGGFGSTGN